MTTERPLLERLERVSVHWRTDGLPVNPDGPEAAALFRELEEGLRHIRSYYPAGHRITELADALLLKINPQRSKASD